MGRESSLTLICIGTSINRGFGCDMRQLRAGEGGASNKSEAFAYQQQ
jgi:hypothetical protein